VRREKQQVLRPAGRLLRLDEVEKTGGGNSNALDEEFAALRPMASKSNPAITM
jgi:hypothetical protein